MTKKFFSFINGGAIHSAPNTKIIPADECSQLLNAAEVLEKTANDAEKYSLDVSKEAEKIKEQAYLDGYEEGYKKWTEELVNSEKRLLKLQEEIKESVIPLALRAAKKIVGRELETFPEAIVDIVSTNIKAVAQHKKIIIYVNRNDWEILEKNKEKIKNLFEDLQSLSVRPREDVKPGGCIIETELGIINGQMDHRWHILEQAFEKLMKTSPESIKGV